MLRRLGLVIAIGVALVAVACASGAGDGQQSAEEPARTGEAGGVTVEARWLTEGSLGRVDVDVSQYPLDEFVLVQLELDTHSGDLNAIDLEEEAALRQGVEELPPQAWLSVSDDQHHRAGILAFRRRLGEGPIELVVTIGEEKVALRWEAVPAN